VDERELTIAWRNLFHGKEITSQALADAQALLDSLTGESPLFIRLANELKELKRLSDSGQQKRRTFRMR
jgi:hypothetical protein